ncbi:hypothetical protein NA56DRAFT_662260 [Hyaloscypha hepaticicola]|uniref:Transmembrane protein n=1 Tax=Hyaloscypha hepaticicola TaxID=2082293 RepID=A0A2J6PTC4_9HELO|nr:hypothetical protein NA56DRAFT_662260 [Hyaloscypha hepaticicola]
MKLQFLALLFTAWAIIIHSQLFVQASPVEQSISPTSISAAPSSTTLPYSQMTSLIASVPTNFTGNSIQAMNKNSSAHLFDDPPPQPAPSDDHTGLKLAGLFVVFVVVILGVLACYCGWKYKGGIAGIAMKTATKFI